MKISVIISGFIIAIAAWLNWHFDVRLAAARTEAKKLTAESKHLGIPLIDAHSTLSKMRERPDRDVEARQLAVEYKTEANTWESVAILGEAASERYSEIHERIAALEASRLILFITDILTDKDTHEIMRAERAVRLLPILAQKDAKAALALLAEYHDTIKISPGAQNVVPNCLKAWADYDPLAAVEWMKKNAAEFPEAMKTQSLHNVIHSTARKDPGLAFTLLSELGLSDSDLHSPLHTIVTSAKTDDERNATLAALRNYRDAHKDNREVTRAANQMFGYFSWGFKESGIKAASKWISGANLSPKELGAFCDELSRNYDGDEHVEWIECMGAALPADLGKSPIMDMISRWADQDYEAAGKWLASAPEGPAKIAATRGYAWHTFKHDPETAMQWVMTLPPGRDRDETLKTIYMNWPKDDPTGKEAFKQQHGLK